MILLTLETPAGLSLGVKTPKGVVDVKAAGEALDPRAALGDPDAFFRHGLDGVPALRALVARALEPSGRAPWLLEERAIEVGPCVPRPGKIVCIGLNYRRHAAEAGMDPPARPVLFSKFGNSVAASGEPVPFPANAVEVDYEAELAVVIGKRARRVSAGRALEHVLGYCNANDLSARDLQFLSGQWLLGKTLDKFFPIGPYVVTADEITDPQSLPIRGWLNGELRQSSSTADMIFTVADIVSYVSQYLPLDPGDVLSTGTPEGVIFGRASRVWMKPGDEYSIEIGPLGRLSNRLVAEAR